MNKQPLYHAPTTPEQQQAQQEFQKELDDAPTTLIVFRQGDRKENPTPVSVRFMTRDEVLAVSSNSHVKYLLNSGRMGDVKINGAVKRWVRSPDRVEIPVKYGMYEHDRLSLVAAMTRFLVEV